MKKRKIWYRLQFLLLFLFMMTITFIDCKAYAASESDADYRNLSNPRLGSTYETTVWDCVWFGTYPQTELTEDELTEDIIHADYDGNGDAVVDGVRYKRLTYDDVYLHSDGTTGHMYNWNEGGDENHNHYFRYEPIKWRVLRVDGDTCLLLADRILEQTLYGEVADFLYGDDYTDFFRQAFSKEEGEAIVKVEDNPLVMFPASSLYSNEQHGFIEPGSIYGTTANRYKKAHVTEYSAAKGVYMLDWSKKADTYGYYWLNDGVEQYSNGEKEAYCIDYFGGKTTNLISYHDNGIRPALYLDLSKDNVWQFAGTFESLSYDDTDKDSKENVNEVPCQLIGGNDRTQQKIIGQSTAIEKVYHDAAFVLQAKSDCGAPLYYESDNSGVAQVDQDGKVTVGKPGTAKITIYAKSSDTYGPAKQVVTINVAKAESHIILANSLYQVQIGEETQGIGISTNHGGEIQYEYSDGGAFSDYSTALRVNEENEILAYKAGTYTVRAYVEESEYYKAAETKFDVVILPRTEQIVPENQEYTIDLGYRKGTGIIRMKKLGNGTVTVTSSDESIVSPPVFMRYQSSVEDGYIHYNAIIKCKKAGDVTLTIQSNSNEYWSQASTEIKIHVTDNNDSEEDEEEYEAKEVSENGEIIYRSKGYVYKVLSEKKKTVRVEKCNDIHGKSYVIPDTYTWDDGTEKVTYKVTEIAPGALKNNKSVTKITIGKNIIRIGANAFSGCKNLTKITIKSTKLTKKSVGKNVLKGTNKKLTIKVPKSKLKDYQKYFEKKGNTSVKIKK